MSGQFEPERALFATKGNTMATQDETQQEQDAFAASFGTDEVKAQMTEDEAFGLTPEVDQEVPDEAEAEVAEEPAIAESAPNDPADAETGEAGPAEETSVVVEPGAADGGDVEVMSPEDIQREKSWIGRLKAKEAELKAREEALKASPAEATEPEAPQVAATMATEAVEEAVEKVESGEMSFDEAMATLSNDFGADFTKMLGVLISSKASEIAGKMADEKVGPLKGELDGLVGELVGEKERTHFESISDAHPDFMEVAASPEFRGYVESLPGTEQEAAMAVINSGSAKQINALLSAYKAKSQVTTEADLPAAEPADESAMDAAEGVRSAGLKIPEKPAQADDYEAAWEAFS
jgi:hypothetical protein